MPNSISPIVKLFWLVPKPTVRTLVYGIATVKIERKRSLHKFALIISLPLNSRDALPYLQSELATATLLKKSPDGSKLMTTKISQLETAVKNLEQAKAKLQKIQGRENEKQRKKETRAKILLGGWMIAHAKKDPKSAHRLKEIISSFSGRDLACFDNLEFLNSGNEEG